MTSSILPGNIYKWDLSQILFRKISSQFRLKSFETKNAIMSLKITRDSNGVGELNFTSGGARQKSWHRSVVSCERKRATEPVRVGATMRTVARTSSYDLIHLWRGKLDYRIVSEQPGVSIRIIGNWTNFCRYKNGCRAVLCFVRRRTHGPCYWPRRLVRNSLTQLRDFTGLAWNSIVGQCF